MSALDLKKPGQCLCLCTDGWTLSLMAVTPSGDGGQDVTLMVTGDTREYMEGRDTPPSAGINAGKFLVVHDADCKTDKTIAQATQVDLIQTGPAHVTCSYSRDRGIAWVASAVPQGWVRPKKATGSRVVTVGSVA